jgi:DNA replication protein DnaD
MTKWFKKGVHSLEDVKPLDEEHKKLSSARKQDAQTKNAQNQNADGRGKSRTTGFSNFKQRDTDLDSRVLAMLKDKL